MSQISATSALQYAREAAWGNQTGPSGEYEPWSSERVVAKQSKTGPHSTPAWDAFVQALAEGRRDVCDTLDAHDRHGTTALHFAAHDGAAGAVRALIAAGASLDPRIQIIAGIPKAYKEKAYYWQVYPGYTPLLVACEGGHHECVSVLVAAGASVHATVPGGGIRHPETTLTFAADADQGSLRCVQVLLEAGASVRVPPNTWSPLHAAIWGTGDARCECAVALLRAGADVNALDDCGRSPLRFAIDIESENAYHYYRRSMQRRSGSRRLISTLLRAGARLPAADTSYRRSWPAVSHEVIAYIDAIRSAGGYARYETMRRAPFITALTRCGGFPIPDDMISIVVGFWVRRALEY